VLTRSGTNIAPISKLPPRQFGQPRSAALLHQPTNMNKKKLSLSNTLLEFLSDGKKRHINEIVEEVAWPTTTNLSKTLTELKSQLLLDRDPRRLRRKKLGNNNKGTIWWLETPH